MKKKQFFYFLLLLLSSTPLLAVPMEEEGILREILSSSDSVVKENTLSKTTSQLSMDPITIDATSSSAATSQNSTTTTSAAIGSVDGHTVTHVQDTEERPTPFNKTFFCDNKGNGDIFKHVDIPLDPTNVWNVFVKQDNRDAVIGRKTDRLTKILENLPKSSYENKIYTDLIGYLQQAKEYQNKMIGHLESTDKDFKAIENEDVRNKKIASKVFLNQQEILKLNEKPNKIERIVDQIEIDCEELKNYRGRYEALEGELAAAMAQDPVPQETINTLQQRIDFLKQAILHQEALIQKRCNSVQYIQPPYETMTPEIQTDLNTNKWAIIREECLAQINNIDDQRFDTTNAYQAVRYILDESNDLWTLIRLEMEKSEPNELMIQRHKKAADLYKKLCKFQSTQYLIADESATVQGQLVAVMSAMKELQASQQLSQSQGQKILNKQQTQEARDLLAQSQYLADQSEDLAEHSHVIRCVLTSLTEAIEEQLKNEPNERVIQRFKEAADCYEKAAHALHARDEEQAKHFNKLGIYLCKMAENDQQGTLKKESIEYFERAQALYEEATKKGTTKDVRMESRRKAYLNHAGDSLMSIAIELQAPQPNQSEIQKFLEKAKRYERTAPQY